MLDWMLVCVNTAVLIIINNEVICLGNELKIIVISKNHHSSTRTMVIDRLL